MFNIDLVIDGWRITYEIAIMSTLLKIEVDIGIDNGAVRQQAITRCKFGLDLWRLLASLGHNESIMKFNNMLMAIYLCYVQNAVYLDISSGTCINCLVSGGVSINWYFLFIMLYYTYLIMTSTSDLFEPLRNMPKLVTIRECINDIWYTIMDRILVYRNHINQSLASTQRQAKS